MGLNIGAIGAPIEALAKRGGWIDETDGTNVQVGTHDIVLLIDFFFFSASVFKQFGNKD